MTTGNEGNPAEATLTQETPKVETPTTTESEATLKAQILEMQQIIDAKDKSYKGLQTTLNKTNEELRKQADLRGEIDTLKETMKIFAAELSERGVISEDTENIPKEKKVDLVKKFDDLAEKQRQKKVLEDFQVKVMEYQTKTKELGLEEDSLEYLDIKDATISGNFARADALIKKVEKSKVSKEVSKEETKKVETPDEMAKRIRLEVMKEFKLTQVEDGQPGGKPTSVQDELQRYIRHEITFDKLSPEAQKKIS